MQLTSCELNQQRQLIRTLAAQAVSISPEQEQQLREQYKMLTLSYGLGKAVYASYSNEELLSVLRQTAAQIGHSPAQHEVFFLYRIYLKARFRTWPKALYAAGMRMLPPSTLGVIDWEKVQKEESEICAALELVSNMQDRLGYPPQKRKVNNAKMLCTRFRTWGKCNCSCRRIPKMEGSERIIFVKSEFYSFVASCRHHAETKMDKGIGCESRTVTAAVSAEAISVGESQSLEKSEKAGYRRWEYSQ